MIIESPVLENYQRHLVFTSIKWLEKREFNDLKLTETIYPSFPLNEFSNETVFIGKTNSYISSSNKQLWIGYVTSITNDNLKIMRADKVIFSSDYYILSLSKESFSWVKTNKANTEKHG